MFIAHRAGSRLSADILLVEDNSATAELFGLALKANKSNATVEVVHDGEAALKIVLGHQPARVPRVLLLDLNMPGLHGLDVLRRLRADERTRQLPVLIYSDSDSEAEKSAALGCGANGFVLKGARFKDMCAAIAQMERDWLQPSTHPSPR